MFTGLVEAVGEFVDRTSIAGGARVRISTPFSAGLTPGDSVAVNGVCLTVIESTAAGWAAELGPETLRVTTLGRLPAGALVNLERPLRADGRFGGHFVQGHVDAIGTVEAVRLDAEFQWLTVGFPDALAPLLIPKGSVAVDGISLTVARLGRDRFDIQVVPFTLQHTNLQRVQVGDPVNLECDMVGKYVARAAELAGLTLVRHSSS
jgi:riboflavin synthase